MGMLERRDDRRAQRDREVRRVVVLEGLANVVALVTKVAVGLTTGSVAVLADALHSVTDAANNVVAYIVMHFAAKPPDKGHPYGHRKFETLAVFVLATLLTVLAVEIVLHAIRAADREVVTSGPGLAAMLGVMVFQILVSWWEARRAEALHSDLLRADARHTLADVFVTIAVITGWQLSARGLAWADTLLTVLVAVTVLYFAFGLFRRVVPVLVDSRAHEPDTVRETAVSVQGVREVPTVRSRWIGSETAIDVVVTVDPQLRMSDAHDIADAVEEALAERFPASFVNVHVEPDETPAPAG